MPEEGVAEPACDELPGAVGAVPGVGAGVVEFGDGAELVEPVFAVDPLGAGVPAAATHGPPPGVFGVFGLDGWAPGIPGIAEAGAVPFCGVVPGVLCV